MISMQYTIQIADKLSFVCSLDWYMNGSNVDIEHRTYLLRLFANITSIEEAEKDFPWPDPELYIDQPSASAL